MKPDRRDMTLAGLEPPTWCHDLLTPFGQNPWGEDIWRVVWSPRRLAIYGGYWEDTGVFEYRIVPRYGRDKFFRLERWVPARHFGSPQSWAAETANGEGYLSAGPYPQYGMFISGYSFCTPEHKYLPILPDLVLLTVQAVHANRVKRSWEVRDCIIGNEQIKELQSDYEFENKWQETHGVRRGASFSKDGALQNTDAEVEQYKQRLAVTPVKIKKEEAGKGFKQYEGELPWQ